MGQLVDIQTKAMQLNYSGESPVIVLCAYCAETFALFHCEQCGDALCIQCEKRLHEDMRHVNQKHKALAINTPVGPI